MCTDERTCRQIREYLEYGNDIIMKRKLGEYFKWKTNFQKSKRELFEKPRIERAAGGSSLHVHH